MVRNFGFHRVQVVAQRQCHILVVRFPLRPAYAVGAVVRRPVDLQPSLQPVPHRNQQLVPAGFVDEGVKRQFGRDAFVVGSAVDRLEQRRMTPLDLVAEPVVAHLPHELEREGLQSGADRIDLLHVVLRQVDDEGRRIGSRDEKAFIDQLADRLAKRSAADAELARQPRFHDLASGREAAVHDRFPKLDGNLLAEGAARQEIDQLTHCPHLVVSVPANRSFQAACDRRKNQACPRSSRRYGSGYRTSGTIQVRLAGDHHSGIGPFPIRLPADPYGIAVRKIVDNRQ